MIRIVNKTECCGCGACREACPASCIEMKRDEEGFLYPSVDESRCLNCSLCEKACPVLSPGERPVTIPASYAARAKDEGVRLASSSGGIFPLLARAMLNNGGAVVGAAFDESFAVKHVVITSAEELPRLMGSKYVQSDMGNTFGSVKELLAGGTNVLFSGTPCQVNALLGFLGGGHEGLITIDLICHGAGSPLLWNRYLDRQRNNAHGKRPVSASFRDKTEGWRRFSLALGFEDGSAYRRVAREDPMMKAFLKDLCLRPSCYDCRFRGLSRNSDITLGDLWGAENIAPELDDDRGTSLVLIHSVKGAELYKSISEQIESTAVAPENALSVNRAARSSPPKPPAREAFMMKLGQGTDIKKLVKKYCSGGLVGRIKSIVKKLIRR